MEPLFFRIKEDRKLEKDLKKKPERRLKKNKNDSEKTETGFSAYSDELSIFTTGRTVPESINNSYEATQLYFADEYEITHDNLRFEIDFE